MANTKKAVDENAARSLLARRLPATRTDIASMSAEDLQALVHELLHQIELESQNEAIRAARTQVAASRDRYSALYERAPVGYLTLDRDSHIEEANLMAASLLKVERQELIGWPLARFFDRAAADRLYQHVHEAFAGGTKQSCELSCTAFDGSNFDAQLESIAALSDERPRCYTILNDITDRKRHERERKQLALLETGRTHILERVARGESLSNVLVGLAETIEVLLPGLWCSLLILDRATNRLRHGAAPSLPQSYCEAVDGLQIGSAVGSCGTAAHTAQRVIVADVLTHPYWTAYTELAVNAGFRACWSEPVLALDGKVLGTFALYYREPREPNPTELGVIEVGAQIAGIAIEHRQTQDALIKAKESLEQRVRERTEELQNEGRLLRKLLELQENERRIVAHDIHDGFIQYAVGARLHVERIVQHSESPEIELVGLLLGKAIDDGRRLIRDLRPLVLDDCGVVEAIEHLIADKRNHEGLDVSFQHEVQFDRLDPKLEVAVYRIVQEALNNVKHHAQTDSASIVMTEHDKTLRLEVSDQGVGFDMTQVAPERFGLRGIRERARLFDGEAFIETSPGKGTTVRVTLPV